MTSQVIFHMMWKSIVKTLIIITIML